MPVVHSLRNVRIRIYPDDHNPPHFHVVGPDWECVVDIGTLTIVRGSPKNNNINDVLEWAGSNREFLMEKWTVYNERDN